MKTPLGAFFNSIDLRIPIIFCIFLFSFNLQAQKKVHRMFLADDITLIQINTANCFEVNLNTSSGKEVAVEAEMEGEYSTDLDLVISTNGSTLLIEANFVPNFENPNDKLSAHKVVSIWLNITLPTSKNVEVYGTNSRVLAKGKYKELVVTLSDGICELYNVFGEAKVKTQSGNIIVLAKAADISTQSKYGTVEYNPIPNGIPTYKLQTVTGNIELIKTE
jgi:hypothetical protein